MSRNTLLDDREYSGLWSLADKPDRKVAGTATYKDGSIMLRLHGRLPRPAVGEHNGDFRPAIVNGRCEGSRVTLYKTRELDSHDDRSSFVASWMLIGKTFTSEAEIKPQELSVGYSHLERWAFDRFPFEVEWERSADVTRTIMTYHPPKTWRLGYCGRSAVLGWCISTRRTLIRLV